ncbi:MAG: hypothetical protein RL607_990 [Bacteroidota bacterium]|jgi:hypothetical protein
MKRIFLAFWFLFSGLALGQNTVQDNAEILKIVLTHFYSNEKPIVKDRLQLLFFYVEKATNTIEIVEGCKNHPILKTKLTEIKKQIQTNTNAENWNAEYHLVFSNQNQYLQKKVLTPVSLAEFQSKTQSYGENNQRMLILNQPIYLPNNYCLLKVGFYRSIEHNSGSFVLLQKINGVWKWMEEFNRWET